MEFQRTTIWINTPDGSKQIQADKHRCGLAVGERDNAPTEPPAFAIYHENGNPFPICFLSDFAARLFVQTIATWAEWARPDSFEQFVPELASRLVTVARFIENSASEVEYANLREMRTSHPKG